MVSSNDVQKLFLQAVASRRTVPQQLAAKLWLKCVEAVKAVDETLDVHYEEGGWNAWVTQLNKALNPLDIEFAHVFDEATGKDMYALVNRKADEIAQLATDYAPSEIVYFKAILEQIMLAPNESFCVSSLAALREVNHVKGNMSKTQAEHVLGSLVAKGWLLKSKRGRYSLSTRTILELQPYLRTTYPDDIVDCTICMEMITSGYACLTPACKLRLHRHCYTNYRKQQSSCPTCKVEWGDDAQRLKKVGEEAFRDGQEKGRRSRRSADVDEEDDEEEEEYDEEQSQSQGQQSSGPSQTQVKVKKEKTAKKKNVVVSDEDEDDMEDDDEPPRTQGKRKSRR